MPHMSLVTEKNTEEHICIWLHDYMSTTLPILGIHPIKYESELWMPWIFSLRLSHHPVSNLSDLCRVIGYREQEVQLLSYESIRWLMQHIGCNLIVNQSSYWTQANTSTQTHANCKYTTQSVFAVCRFSFLACSHGSVSLTERKSWCD